ncbi:Monogalactosyldiacylglycerol synthase 2 [Hibiscus syriacus]|uniref:Monogalactosyldiacylglycerol synthase 2 n=1 Tax=Hibiscus syriacus TaxID=106335 RepID=A0A6A3B547_HIBSY|nr:Monogalactosyldiacylglycerol synthase 2 [Hibiscus syriacus]
MATMTNVSSSSNKVASITEKVWQTVYGKSSSGSISHLRRCSYENDDEFEDYDGFGTVPLMQMGAERTKNVLILMSDTGGGHRASAEAIRDAFRIEFGDDYQIFVKDVWKEYTGCPLNDMERSYKFMVKHVQLWKVAFHSTSPRWGSRAGLMEYKPDIIISVHPINATHSSLGS